MSDAPELRARLAAADLAVVNGKVENLLHPRRDTRPDWSDG